jgi:hypothetical protein
MDLCGSGCSSVAGSCECKNELSGSTKGGQFPDQLNECEVLKTYYA